MIVTDVTFRLRGALQSEWVVKNPILQKNEIGIEEDTNRFKIGDGLLAWDDLPYFINADAVAATVNETLAELSLPPGLIDTLNQVVTQIQFSPSLTSLYNNAKAGMP